MAGLAERMIVRGIPFFVEKPCGLNLQEVRRIRQLSEKHGVYVSVPFIMRVSDLAARLSPAEGFTPRDISISRSGSSWARSLDMSAAGVAGCLTNGMQVEGPR